MMIAVRMLVCVCVLFVLFVSDSRCDQADRLAITAGGSSDYVIVLSASASESEKFAARELADFVRQISGAELAIRADSGTPAAKAIYVGFGESVAALGVKVDLEELSTDGFVIRTAGENLVIAGGRRRGTLYGVYDFLERLGCRWWTPWESFIPSNKNISVGQLDIKDIPTLEYRDMMYGEMFTDEAKLWGARNKVNGMAWGDTPEHLGGRYEFVGNLVHSYMGLLEQGSGGEITDDMIALYNGKRQRTQPCLSNPKVLEAISKAVVQKCRENPTARFVSVGQNDNYGYCHCENCQKIIDKYTNPSGIVVWFANKVLAEVRKEVPDARICTAAYQWSRKPPVGIKPDDGVYITLCSIECDFAHPLSTGSTDVNREFRDDIVGWGRIAKNIFIWDYTPNFHHFLMPHPNLDVLGDNIRFFAENSAAGVFEQGCHSSRAGELSELRMWVLARCLWNPQLDSAKVIDEFVKGYYGPAAASVSQYCELYQQMVRSEPDKKMRMMMEPSAWYLHPKTVARSLKILTDAESLVADQGLYQRRLSKVKLAPQYVLLKAGANSNSFAQAASAVPSLSYKAMADEFTAAAKDWQVGRVAERDYIAPWLGWLGSYASLLSDGKPVWPLEADEKARVIQAGQMDAKLGKLVAADGASDGWAMDCSSSGWVFRKFFTTFDDVTPGQAYKLLVRVKGVPKDAADSDKAFIAGVRSSNGNKTLRVAADEIDAEDWQVFEVGQWTAADSDYMFIALQGGSCLQTVLLDAMWLEPVK